MTCDGIEHTQSFINLKRHASISRAGHPSNTPPNVTLPLIFSNKWNRIQMASPTNPTMAGPTEGRRWYSNLRRFINISSSATSKRRRRTSNADSAGKKPMLFIVRFRPRHRPTRQMRDKPHKQPQIMPNNRQLIRPSSPTLSRESSSDPFSKVVSTNFSDSAGRDSSSSYSDPSSPQKKNISKSKKSTINNISKSSGADDAPTADSLNLPSSPSKLSFLDSSPCSSYVTSSSADTMTTTNVNTTSRRSSGDVDDGLQKQQKKRQQQDQYSDTQHNRMMLQDFVRNNCHPSKKEDTGIKETIEVPIRLSSADTKTKKEIDDEDFGNSDRVSLSLSTDDYDDDDYGEEEYILKYWIQ